MPIYNVTVPIAGHAVITVEAADEEAAKEAALETVTQDDIEDWEALERFIRGNVCYCPGPWRIEIEEVTDEELPPA